MHLNWIKWAHRSQWLDSSKGKVVLENTLAVLENQEIFSSYVFEDDSEIHNKQRDIQVAISNYIYSIAQKKEMIYI